MKKWKFFLISFFVIVLTGGIIWKLYTVQIKKGDRYRALALGQQTNFQTVSGERGKIFFNKGKTTLAKTKRKNLIYVFPQKMEEKGKVKSTLKEILPKEKGKIDSFFKKENTFKQYLTKEQKEKIIRKDLPEVHLDKVWEREYPRGENGSLVTGFVNHQGEGQYGIEGYFNSILKGKEDIHKEESSPFGYLPNLFETGQEDILRGANIFLTLNYNLQYFARKTLKKAEEKWNIDSGQIIVMEPSTGKIKAMVAYPSFNPEKYGKEKQLESFLNPAIQKLYEPGSVFKPFVMAAGLEENEITPETTYKDKGSADVGGSPIYNWRRKEWGKQTMTDVLKNSINTGAVFVQQKLGRDKFLKYLKKFGFFNETNIRLAGEQYSSNQNLRTGYARDIAVASFGQGIEITPIQLIRGIAAIANGGELMRPLIVNKIKNIKGEIRKIKPKIQRKVISKTAAAKLTSMLIEVVKEGSGREAKIEGYYIAGKTGTAQVPLKTGGYSKDKTIQSFVSFFPALDPKFVVLIKLNNPKDISLSSHSAVPLGKELIKYIINYYEIPPSYKE